MNTVDSTVAALVSSMSEFESLVRGVADASSAGETNTEQETEETQNEPEYPLAEANINEYALADEASEKLPDSAETFMQTYITSRFSSAVWFNHVKEQTITVAGIGGIGSYVAFLLSRMQPSRIALYDDDIVEAGNMSGQLYSSKDLGTPKVTAISNMIHNYSNYHSILGLRQRFEATSSPDYIMICGFDNMAARRTFYTSWKNFVNSLDERNRKHCLFIDGRLAAEEFQVFCIRGDDSYSMERYERDWLFSDEEADETICSYKQTTFMANMIGSVIVNLFVNFCANDIEGEDHPFIERDLPFLTTYDALMMMFKTEA